MKKILLIEPNHQVREEYREVLGAAGFEVYTAVDGKAGLDLLWHEKPDCVLLEILLPKINGFEILQKARSQVATEKLPIILFTELGHADDMARARHLGAHDYCIKAHHTPAQVVKKIKDILRAVKKG